MTLVWTRRCDGDGTYVGVCQIHHTAHTYIFWQVGQQRELIAAKLDINLSSPSESEPSVMFHLSWGGYAGKFGALIVRLVTYYLVGGMT